MQKDFLPARHPRACRPQKDPSEDHREIWKSSPPPGSFVQPFFLAFPSLFVCLYPKHPRGVCMLKNSSRSKKLLATNSSHSGSAAAALSPLTSWAAAAGSRAAANQRQAALATPFSFATSTPLPLTRPTLISTNAVHSSLQSPFFTFSWTL